MSNALTTLSKNLSAKFGMGEEANVLETLKATAFKGQVSDAQMTALLIVANQYGLNPWTKEIYAFPDKNNGIVPVVGVDGWSRIMNDHPQFDGMDFEIDDESCTCKIYRKDRSHPIQVTEYMSECKRNVGPWTTHPKRMLRHKAMIQCARLAFGFVGIYDEDEAARIREVDMGKAQVVDPSLPTISVERLDQLFAAVESVTSLEELREVYSAGNAEMLAAKFDNKSFKQACTDRSNELKAIPMESEAA
ncbi:phage recombination protein Bet [Polynucleobacter paneuropaeus]|uniref:phage recombination protein Bet n=1 Tax=Polynucleobacter paneuropaeus TaxID=2527775 RepID=UPI001BFE8D8B|nr:phage recombination protein Bet [Polynucleobacter paneuropaeus]QWD55284.1 phage recombination protein Bet [Polynucleobacter paneuropaeus]